MAGSREATQREDPWRNRVLNTMHRALGLHPARQEEQKHDPPRSQADDTPVLRPKTCNCHRRYARVQVKQEERNTAPFRPEPGKRQLGRARQERTRRPRGKSQNRGERAHPARGHQKRGERAQTGPQKTRLRQVEAPGPTEGPSR